MSEYKEQSSEETAVNWFNSLDKSIKIKLICNEYKLFSTNKNFEYLLNASSSSPNSSVKKEEESNENDELRKMCEKIYEKMCEKMCEIKNELGEIKREIREVKEEVMRKEEEALAEEVKIEKEEEVKEEVKVWKSLNELNSKLCMDTAKELYKQKKSFTKQEFINSLTDKINEKDVENFIKKFKGIKELKELISKE
jgi:hypothetical protein